MFIEGKKIVTYTDFELLLVEANIFINNTNRIKE